MTFEVPLPSSEPLGGAYHAEMGGQDGGKLGTSPWLSCHFRRQGKGSGTWGLGRLAGDVGVGKNDVMHQTTIFGFRNRGIRRDSVVYGVRLRSRGARET